MTFSAVQCTRHVASRLAEYCLGNAFILFVAAACCDSDKMRHAVRKTDMVI